MAKKKWPIVIAVIVVIGVIGAFRGGGNEDTKDEGEKTEEVSEKKVYKVKDVVPVGDVEYVVNEVSSSNRIGDEYVGIDAKNVFYIVDVTIKNNGTEALTVSDSYFHLVSGEKTYNADSYGAMYLGEDSIIFDEINPDASLTGKVVFDITQETIDAKDLVLQVQTEAFGSETENISLK